jgi:hypothetical protein
MENEEAQEKMDMTFLSEPAILDKYKAAAAVCDGKLTLLILIFS